jgi:hypothetical protein
MLQAGPPKGEPREGICNSTLLVRSYYLLVLFFAGVQVLWRYEAIEIHQINAKISIPFQFQ